MDRNKPHSNRKKRFDMFFPFRKFDELDSPIMTPVASLDAARMLFNRLFDSAHGAVRVSVPARTRRAKIGGARPAIAGCRQAGMRRDGSQQTST
jgi:hypothetical protein